MRKEVMKVKNKKTGNMLETSNPITMELWAENPKRYEFVSGKRIVREEEPKGKAKKDKEAETTGE